MAHLRKTSSGHLAKVTNGHLRRWAVRCGCCLPGTIYVTFSGLAGYWAIYNGKHGRVYGPGDNCFWGVYSGVVFFLAPRHFGGGDWDVIVRTDISHWMYWERLDVACDPTGSYTRYSCQPTADCDASAGATCVVSLT